MSNKAAIVSVKDKVGHITFNRPDKMNAINGEMMEILVTTLRQWSQDPEIGCVVLTGEGRAFCAGGDISGNYDELALEEKVDYIRAGQEISWTLHNMPKITIAAVNGFALGAGLGIAMSCDMRIASDKSKYGTAFAKVGLSGNHGVTWQLTQLVGEAKAKEMMVLAEIIDAQEAHHINLVNRVVEHDLLESAVAEMATGIAQGPLVSYRWIKENINLAMRSDFRAILDRDAITQTICTQSTDHKEGLAAFAEGRDPQFQGR